MAGGPASHLPQDRLAAPAARIPAARLVTVDAGHAIPATRPADLSAAVRDFLPTTDRPGDPPGWRPATP
ncbi:hypothetical protein [Micromonospora sp. MS34]|uniref:hypothetical protein n=1 Tax=Micromonospora sp. MS34 TaxID=3385971 RepID=UPI0039A390C8